MELGPKVGPFPAGVWVGLVGVGVVAGVAVRRAGWFADDPAPVIIDEPTGVPASSPVRPTGSIPLPGTSMPSPTPAPVDTAPTDNNEWARQAVELLITKGVTPTVGDTAIRKYLGGMALGQAELAAINLALSSPLGPPPEGAPPITTTTTTDDGTNPVEPPRLPALTRKEDGSLYKQTTTVAKRPDGKGETARQVSMRVYGDPNSWNYLRWGNPQAIGPDGFAPLRVGVILRY